MHCVLAKSDAVKMFNSGAEAERTSNYTEAIFYYPMAIDMDSKYELAYENAVMFTSG
jgi:hypothetical protein